ncbi:MAG: ABC transporter ATP-binding protein, partial [Actinomycetales bacterium]
MSTLLPTADRRTTARLAWRLVRTRRVPLAATFVTFAVTGLAGLVPVWMIGRIIDAVREDSGTDAVVRAVVLMVVAGVVGALSTAASNAALALAAAPALAELREEVLDRALHLDVATIERAGTGDVVARVGDDVRKLTESLDEAVPALLGSVMAVGFTAGGLFALDWRLGLAGLAIVPAYASSLRWYLPRSAPVYAQERISSGARAEALVAGLDNAPTLRALAREREALASIESRSRDTVEVTMTVFRLYTRFGFRGNYSELLGLTLVLTAGFLMVRSGAGTVGEATTAALFFHRLFNPIGALMYVFDEIQSSGASLARLAGVAGMPVAAPSDHDVDPRPTLELRGVTHSYEPGRPVLHGVDLVVPHGERVAVVGATGAGKTTLGAIAAGTLPVDEGHVLLAGRPLGDLDPVTLRRHVALVSQEVHVFAGTIADNLRLADGAATDDVLWGALARCGADAWVRSLTEGLDTAVGSLAHPLTPAQAQQLALARVVL